MMPGKYNWQYDLTLEDAEFVLGAISLVPCDDKAFSTINNWVGMNQRVPHTGMEQWTTSAYYVFSSYLEIGGG